MGIKKNNDDNYIFERWIDRVNEEIEMVWRRQSSDDFTIDYSHLKNEWKKEENVTCEKVQNGSENMNQKAQDGIEKNEKPSGNENDMKTGNENKLKNDMKKDEKVDCDEDIEKSTDGAGSPDSDNIGMKSDDEEWSQGDKGSPTSEAGDSDGSDSAETDDTLVVDTMEPVDMPNNENSPQVKEAVEKLMIHKVNKHNI